MGSSNAHVVQPCPLAWANHAKTLVAQHEKSSCKARLARSCHSTRANHSKLKHGSTSRTRRDWHELSMARWHGRASWHGQPVPLSCVLHFPCFLSNFCDGSTRPCFMVISRCLIQLIRINVPIF